MSYLALEWLAWMAAAVAVFWLTLPEFRFIVLSGLTLAFLLTKDPASAGILVMLTSCTYLLSRGTPVSGKRATLAVLLIAGVLIAFKALNATAGDDLLTSTVIPLGLSYYALRCIGYVLERYRGRIADGPASDLIAYLFFLPTIYIGPIHRFASFARDRRRHRWDTALFSEGLERILYGYVKITVLGNFLVSGLLADRIAGIDPGWETLILYLEMVRTGLNLYFQFAGYSDIAIGFARLLGVRVMENFEWPFLQKNISAFWRCWHISLTSWCREYIYTTVVALTRSPALGSVATLIVVGLWHEISLRYLLWGCYHGLGIIVWQQIRRMRPFFPTVEAPILRRLIDVASVLLTLHFVWLGFLLVRQPDFVTVGDVLGTLLFFWL